MDAILCWLPIFIKYFSLVTCNVYVPLYSCNSASWRLSTSSQWRLRNKRWWWCEERAAAASFAALLIPLQSQCLSFSFQEKCGVCGRAGSAINAGCQKENAGVYTMPLNHWLKVFLLHSPPLRKIFPRKTKKQKAKSQWCIEWKLEAENSWSSKEDSVVWSLGKPSCKYCFNVIANVDINIV